MIEAALKKKWSGFEVSFRLANRLNLPAAGWENIVAIEENCINYSWNELVYRMNNSLFPFKDVLLCKVRCLWDKKNPIGMIFPFPSAAWEIPRGLIRNQLKKRNFKPHQYHLWLCSMACLQPVPLPIKCDRLLFNEATQTIVWQGRIINCINKNTYSHTHTHEQLQSAQRLSSNAESTARLHRHSKHRAQWEEGNIFAINKQWLHEQTYDIVERKWNR